MLLLQKIPLYIIIINNLKIKSNLSRIFYTSDIKLQYRKTEELIL